MLSLPCLDLEIHWTPLMTRALVPTWTIRAVGTGEFGDLGTLSYLEACSEKLQHIHPWPCQVYTWPLPPSRQRVHYEIVTGVFLFGWDNTVPSFFECLGIPWNPLEAGLMPLLKYVWNCLPGEEPHKASLQANFLLLILSYVTRDSQGQPCSCFTFPNIFFLTGPRYFNFFKKKKNCPLLLYVLSLVSLMTQMWKSYPKKSRNPRVPLVIFLGI